VELQKVNAASPTGFSPVVLKRASFFIRILLGGLFVFAGATKVYDPGAFAIELQRYQAVPWTIGALLALYLPWLEMLAGAFLLFRKIEWGPLLIITLLLFIFTVALASAMLRGLNIDCGCFGKTFAATGTVLPLLRNLTLLGGTAVLWTESQRLNLAVAPPAPALISHPPAAGRKLVCSTHQRAGVIS
jgi:putative oxidoreductase